MDKSRMLTVAALSLASACAMAGGSITGKDYTNFGDDLNLPVIAKKQAIELYKNKGDPGPAVSFKNFAQITTEKNPQACWEAKPVDGWVKCRLNGEGGWLKREDFFGPAEYAPIEKWPFRYWAYVAGSNMGEEGVMLFRAVAHSPYLIKPEQFDQAFFLALFDAQGFAISPKDNKKTGDRVFVVANAVYLAPADPDKRLKKKWLFLGYYNEALSALCPSSHKESCYSAVNLAPDWTGIKAFHTSASGGNAFDAKAESAGKRIWYGPEEVAFARHADPVVPLLYKVPDEISMKGEVNPTEAGKKKNREKPFCLIDCNGVANPVKFNAKLAQ